MWEGGGAGGISVSPSMASLARPIQSPVHPPEPSRFVAVRLHSATRSCCGRSHMTEMSEFFPSSINFVRAFRASGLTYANSGSSSNARSICVNVGAQSAGLLFRLRPFAHGVEQSLLVGPVPTPSSNSTRSNTACAFGYFFGCSDFSSLNTSRTRSSFRVRAQRRRG